MAERVIVDISAIDDLKRDLTVAKQMSLGRLGERGYQHLRHEIHDSAYVTGNLEQGVAPPEIDNTAMTATLVVSARSGARGSMPATVHYPASKRHPEGSTKAITLRPQLPFNYAEAVAHGRVAIKPKVGKAILIPVLSRPSDEPYITQGDQIFVVRGSAKAFAGTHFDEKAAEKLEAEAPSIVGKVFEELFT